MSATTLWEEGHEPGHSVVSLGVAVVLTAVAIDITLSEDLGLLFDLSFVVLCVALALMVRPRDFFTIGVLPPLMMLGVVLLLAVAVPEAVSTRHSDVVGTVVAGLAHHAGALVIGYALCLGILANRQRYLTR